MSNTEITIKEVEIAKLNVKAGDRLVIQMAEKPTLHVLNSFKNQLKKFLPEGVDAMFMVGDIELKVITND